MLNKVLAEKENYIGKLEQELNDIRVESERLKDKLIVYELDHMAGTAGHPHLKASFNNYDATNKFTNYNDKTMVDSRGDANQHTQ